MNKVLVTYASRCGSTAEVSQTIAERLGQRGETVDVRPVEQIRDLSQYKAVVLGSAVRMGRWLTPGVKFVQEHAAELGSGRTAIFTVHMLALDGSEASRKQRDSYTEPVRAILTPRCEAFFAGKIDMHKMDFGERMMSRAVMGGKDDDRRDWATIRAWADGLELN